MFTEKKYVIVVVYLDEEMTDIAGHEFPASGFINSDNFTRDIDIRNGYYGVLWGKTHYFPYEKLDRGYWAVVKTDYNDNLIMVDSYHNRVKFKNGIILYLDRFKKISNFILDNKDDPQQGFLEESQWLIEEEIIGSKKWLQERKDENCLYI